MAQGFGPRPCGGRPVESSVDGGRLRLTVLGSSNAIPRPGRACSSYLIEGAGRAVVADLGSGALGNLYRHRTAESIDAVVVSHMHADHFFDLIPLRYALKYGPRTNDKKIALWLPDDGEAMLRRLTSAFTPDSPNDFLGEVFDVGTYDATKGLHVGDLRLRFAAADHYVPTYALRCDAGGASVTYSADTAPADAIVELANETDLFLCEATLRSGDLDSNPRGHTSAREAGEMAQRAAAATLILTHYPAEFEPAFLEAQARETFAGTIAVADDHARFEP